MNRDEAERVVVQAAGEWANELASYVIPHAWADEDAKAYGAQVAEINEALAVINGSPVD